MQNGNVVFAGFHKGFTPEQKALLEYCASVTNRSGRQVVAVFGKSDEGDAYCVFVNVYDEVVAHYAKIDGRFIAETRQGGYREGATLSSVMIDQLQNPIDPDQSQLEAIV
jgi:hypothetical protein